MKRSRPKKPRQPKGFRAQRPGEVLALDTVIAIRDGVRRTLFGCLDLRSRFALALVTPGFSSKRAGDFFDLAPGLFPGRVDRVLSENGSEFEGAFARLLKAKGIGRYHTYPRSPKRNAHLERFNRTVQEEFLIHHEDLLRGDRADPGPAERETGRVAAPVQTGSAPTTPWRASLPSRRSSGTTRSSALSTRRPRPR